MLGRWDLSGTLRTRNQSVMGSDFSDLGGCLEGVDADKGDRDIELSCVWSEKRCEIIDGVEETSSMVSRNFRRFGDIG